MEVPPLDEEQKKIISTPVKEIPVDQLFTPVPLVARLTQGVPTAKELVLRQREETKKLAKSPPKGQPRPPEARVSTFSNSGALKMGFSSAI